MRKARPAFLSEQIFQQGRDCIVNIVSLHKKKCRQLFEMMIVIHTNKGEIRVVEGIITTTKSNIITKI
ncbi:MAG: hypothetical protein WC159_07190, partial [Sphaerochaetaceae bacterium]